MDVPDIIHKDRRRFREIIKGRIREDLKKFISQSEMIGKKGNDAVSIPIAHIDLPRFRFNYRQQTGVGQGEGGIGQPIAPDGPGDDGPAGTLPGYHILEVELTMAELAQILGDELGLPRIEPKGNKTLTGEKVRYTDIRRSGPESLRHTKRTYIEALKRMSASGTYNPDKPVIIPIGDDKRYRSWRVYPKPHNNAVIFYLMDVSGSMTDTKKEIVRLTAFWIDTWIKANYKNVTVRYIAHDTDAAEVDEHTFYHLRQGGGTMISSAYKKTQAIIDREYDPNRWNIYVFHFSDGENFSGDNNDCYESIQELLEITNMIAYGQVGASSWAKEFVKGLSEIGDNNLVVAKIQNNNQIYDAIKKFLGKGH